MWLLAIALPLQGVSAATMLACGAGQHTHAGSGVARHSHAGLIAARHADAHDVDAISHEHAGIEHTRPRKTDLADDVAHKCSACASCCLNAAVPTEAVLFDSLRLPDLFAPLVEVTLPAYLTEGLERPPRFFLA
jgi:hypothetical protein